jgi:hypothetical protein
MSRHADQQLVSMLKRRRLLAEAGLDGGGVGGDLAGADSLEEGGRFTSEAVERVGPGIAVAVCNTDIVRIMRGLAFARRHRLPPHCQRGSIILDQRVDLFGWPATAGHRLGDDEIDEALVLVHMPTMRALAPRLCLKHAAHKTRHVRQIAGNVINGMPRRSLFSQETSTMSPAN